MPLRWSEPEAQPVGSKGGEEVPPTSSAAVQRGANAGAVPEVRDPYVRWARLTDWRGMRRQGGWNGDSAEDRRIQILGMVEDEIDDIDLADYLRRLAKASGAEIPPCYFDPIPGTRQVARHFTAWVPFDRFDDWCRASQDVRWELSQPRRDAETIAKASSDGYFGPERDTMEFRAPNLLADALTDMKPTKPTKPGKLTSVLAVIDFGCPFLNSRFIDHENGKTRIKALWDQGSNASVGRGPGWPWTTPPRLDYGREATGATLQRMVEAVHQKASEPAQAIEETAAYRGIDYLIVYDDARHRVWFATHGGHVLDAAGGATDIVTGAATDTSQLPELVFVQLPSLTAADSSGASLGSHLLDGVRYVLEQCADDARIVVSISYGSHGGPHNGRSLIEQAFDELLTCRSDNFAIVLAAGNSREKACHATRTVAPQRSALLRCQLSPGDTTDTFVEAWIEPTGPGWAIETRVRAPNRLWSPWTPAGQQQVMVDTAAEHEVIAMLRHDAPTVTGCGKALVLLAVAPTEQPSGVPCATADAGLWEIEVALRCTDTSYKDAYNRLGLIVDARIERDDPGHNPGAVEHRFADQDAADDLDTLSSLCTGELTVVAGGYRLSDGDMVRYSAVGPQPGQRRTGPPMVLAPCEEDESTPNLQGSAVRSGDVFRMNGTSVAAPVLARRLHVALSERTEKGDKVARADWPALLADLCRDPASLVKPLP